jgi:hypothetical protein
LLGMEKELNARTWDERGFKKKINISAKKYGI